MNGVACIRIAPLGRIWFALLTLTVVALTTFSLFAQESSVRSSNEKRILILFETESTLVAAQHVSAGLLSGFRGDASMVPELYSEHLDLVRFQDEKHRRDTSQFLKAKYQEIPIDLVIAVGPIALSFMLEHGIDIAPGKPIVAGGITEDSLQETGARDGLFAVVSHFDVEKSVDLALRLQPDASEIVVLTGSSDFDRSWKAKARQALGTSYGGLEVVHLTNLSLIGFKEAVARLPPTAILMMLTVFQDADGAKYVPSAAAAEIVAVSGAPAYTVYSTFVGQGVVGGYVETFEAVGADLAVFAKRILAGEISTQQFVRTSAWLEVDWRQLKRWAIDPKLLPSNTRLKFYNPTIWEQYWWIILLVLMATVAQTLFIVRLLYERKLRTAAEREVRSRVSDLARMNRVHVASELSASIAHEVNQPLSSIVNHGSAAIRWLAARPSNMSEAKTSLERVVAEALRASQIIENIRNMISKGVENRTSVSMDEVVGEAIDLLRGELARKHVRIVTKVSRNMLPVSADRIQLQQVILNLIRNAIDALDSQPEDQRQVQILVNVRSAKYVTVTVADNGPGIEMDSLGKLFQPFFTTKQEGMGMGLAICRSIVQAHGGRLTASRRQPHGMAFRMVLPVAGEQADEG